MNNKLSEHFSSNEFACRCGCGACEVSPELITVLEDVRAHFNAPVTIVSGRRCTAHNAKVGGAKSSQHLLGTAADIQVKGVQPAAVATYFEGKYPGRYGVGRYATFTHIDVRPGPARWKQ
ncbi:D-Ala-D-Ala carboxypeptidase family metallohydrolase [Serratia fonticola]